MAGQFTERLQSADIIALLIRALDAPAAPWFEMVANRVSSNKDSEQYVWLGSAPVMRKWRNGRMPGTLSENKFRVYNEKFEASMEILEEWMERDHTGQIRMKIAEMAERAVNHKFELLSTLIDAADTTVCYDGQYFFDTDHSEGDSGSQSNVNSDNIGTVTAPTVAEMETAIMDSIEQMLGLKDDKGKITNGSAKDFLVVVPVNMMKALAAVLKSEVVIESGASRSNYLMATKQLTGFNINGLVNPLSTNTDAFNIFRTDAAVKPFIYQVEKDITVKSIAEGSEHAILNGTYLYALDARYNVGLNQWRGAIQVQFT